MIIIYIDIILLVILLCLTVFTCAYCFYRVYRLQRAGHVTVLLRPTKVLFSHKREGESTEELRTVVAYQNPFTGDYCVHKSRPPRGYHNSLPPHPSLSPPHSPDSGLSDEYEPLNMEAMPRVNSLELPDGPLLPKYRGYHDCLPPHPSSSPPHSPDSCLSDNYEPLNMDAVPRINSLELPDGPLLPKKNDVIVKPPMVPKRNEDDNTVSKTWNWNYTEYQI